MFSSLLKDVIKDRALDEEAQRMRSGTVPSTEASVPVELGASPFWCVDVSPTWKHPEALLLGFLWGFFFSHRYDHLLTTFSSGEVWGGRAESPKLLIMARSFW